METKTVENENEVINTKNEGTMTTVKEMKKELNKEVKVLENMVNKKRNNLVIIAQKEVIESLKQEIAQMESKEKASTIILKDDVLTFRLAKEGNDVSKRIALVKYNRTIESKKVDTFINIIASNQYEEAYPIIVAEAQNLIEEGYTITDINEEVINSEMANEYFVILDGQHRSTAFAKLNAAGNKFTIPNVYVKPVKDLGSYLENINRVGNWDKKAKHTVAALTTKQELFINLANLIKEGFNPSTASLIYTKKNISDKVISKALRREEYQLPQSAIVDIVRGNKFITLCKAAGMGVIYITKRYFIKGFNSYAAATNEEQAFEALTKLKELKLNNEMLNTIKEEEDFIEMLKRVMQD